MRFEFECELLYYFMAQCGINPKSVSVPWEISLMNRIENRANRIPTHPQTVK